MFILTDDGTMDTVLACLECGEEARYNFANAESFPDGEEGYAAFVDWALADADEEHDCGQGEEG